MFMILWLAKRVFSRRKRKVDRNTAAVPAPTPASRPVRPEWEHVLTASLEQNCTAPPDEVVLHSFDLYRDALYAPCLERRHEMADLYVGITADIAALQASAPALVERAVARHPYEFAHIIDHKE